MRSADAGRRRHAPRIYAALVASLLMHQAAVAAQRLPVPFSACVAAADEWSYTELLCIWRTGAQQQRLAEARRHLRQLGGGDATRPWATLVLGHATLNDDEPEAVRLYEQAAETFRRLGEAEGEVIARQNLRLLFNRRGEAPAASRQVALAREAADTSKAPLAIVRASVLEAAHIVESGGDMGYAHRALRRAEQFAFPSAPIALRRAVLFNLANANLYLGRLDDAIDVLERHRALRAEDGAVTDAAAVAFNLLNAHVAQAETRPSPSRRAELVRMAEATLAEIQELDRPYVEAQARRVLSDLLRPTERARALIHLRRCLEIEASLGYPEIRASCLWSLALLEAETNPSTAEQFSREAIRLTSAHGGILLPFAWQARLRLVWHTLPPAPAIAESLAALDAIERLRARQGSGAARAALFHNWTRDYYTLTGRLLQAQPADIHRAFEVGERMRARVLLEHLAVDGDAPSATAADGIAARQELDRSIAVQQRRLLGGGLPPHERGALLDQLELLELERADQADGDVPAADATTISFASIEAVQRALHAREAMLWFSIGPAKDLYDDFGGGAWVLVITRDGVSTHRLAPAVAFDRQVAALIGLLGQRDARQSAWAPAAEAVGRTLLAGALGALPSDAEHLTIVSDGILHRLPFESLPGVAPTETLGERFQISVVPSATIWLRLRSAQSIDAAAATLVLADPELPHGMAIGDAPLDPLPGARTEAAAIARILRLDAAAVRQGSAASESAVKDTSGRRYGLLHLAAHARADGVFPERSAVFLAAGSGREDGWLQPHEIAALDLRGSLVVLSACDSANGALLSGEGPLSLARAFFAAGASVVVATRWPLRDADAAFLMEGFYRELATGASVSRALQRARAEAIRAGRPAALWAGVAVLGDGARTAVHVPATPSHRLALSGALLAAALVIVGLLALQARRRD